MRGPDIFFKKKLICCLYYIILYYTDVYVYSRLRSVHIHKGAAAVRSHVDGRVLGRFGSFRGGCWLELNDPEPDIGVVPIVESLQDVIGRVQAIIIDGERHELILRQREDGQRDVGALLVAAVGRCRDGRLAARVATEVPHVLAAGGVAKHGARAALFDEEVVAASQLVADRAAGRLGGDQSQRHADEGLQVDERGVTDDLLQNKKRDIRMMVF